MPFEIIAKGSGYKVHNVEKNKYYSKKPISKKKADAQMRVLKAIEKRSK